MQTIAPSGNAPGNGEVQPSVGGAGRAQDSACPAGRHSNAGLAPQT